MPEPTLLDRLREQRAARVDAWSTLIATRETERAAFEARTDVPEADVETFRAAEATFKTSSDEHESEIRELDERIRVQDDIVARRAAAGAGADVVVTNEPLTYRRDNAGEHSYFRDLVVLERPDMASRIRSASLPDARERLLRHATEMDVEMPKRAEARERRAAKQVEEAEDSFQRSIGRKARGLDYSPFERRATPSRTQGNGGYFVPPLYWDEMIPALRAGRVAAGLARNMDLPTGTDSIVIPKISTATLTGIQSSDNTAVTSQDFTDTAVIANVKTIAGQCDVPIQLLDQSPYYLDEALLTDLMADYNKRLDLQVLNGNGTATSVLNGGQVVGLYPTTNWSGTNTVTYTNSTLTSDKAWHLLSVMGAMASQIATNRFGLSSLAFVLHPRRAFWYLSGTDSNNRPLVEPENVPGFNVAAVEADSVPAEGLVGRLPFGPGIFADANVTTIDNTDGGGATRDIAYGAIWDDCWLFEGEPRTRVMNEVLSGTLQVRIQVYNYLAFAVRYGQSIAVATGTGFAPPQGAVTSVTF